MLRILGDINFTDGFFDTGFGVGSSVESGKDPFAKLNRKSEDFWLGNFECVCSDCSNLSGTHARQFRISPRLMQHFTHLDFYGVANNHVMQHGQEAYMHLLDFLDSEGILYAGTKEKKTVVVEHQGKKVAITVFNQRPENFTKPPLYWAMPEYSEIAAELGKYHFCDFRIVYVHWGIEFVNYPYVDQKQFAHFLIDSGADLVVGMHPHVLQGYELYKEKYIFYSLGNCVFNMPWEPTKFSLMVNVDLAAEEVTYDYLHIDGDYFPSVIKVIPHKYTMENLNALLDICEDNEIYFAKAKKCMAQYRKANRKNIARNAWRLSYSDFFSIASDFVKRKMK
jgi:hypothetical protein